MTANTYTSVRDYLKKKMEQFHRLKGYYPSDTQARVIVEAIIDDVILSEETFYDDDTVANFQTKVKTVFDIADKIVERSIFDDPLCDGLLYGIIDIVYTEHLIELVKDGKVTSVVR